MEKVRAMILTKTLIAGKDRGPKEKGVTEDKMVGWHHRPNGHEFEQTLGNGEGPGSLACCSPWGHQELDTTERLNNDEPAGYYLLPCPLTPEFKMHSHPRILKPNMERSSGDAPLVGLVYVTDSQGSAEGGSCTIPRGNGRSAGGVWSHHPSQPHLISVSDIKIPGKKWLKSQEGGQISSSLIFKGYLMKLG